MCSTVTTLYGVHVFFLRGYSVSVQGLRNRQLHDGWQRTCSKVTMLDLVQHSMYLSREANTYISRLVVLSYAK